jgi:hypothetical protein
VNVETGELKPGPLSPPVQQRNGTRVSSPDGRYQAIPASPDDYRAGQQPRDASGCTTVPLLRLEDDVTGTTRIIMPCGANAMAIRWLDASHFLAIVYECGFYCESHHRTDTWLVDAATGSAVDLTVGYEDGGFEVLEPEGHGLAGTGFLSPDGSMIAIGGAHLRVYSLSGALVRDFGSPAEGFEFKSVAWSPDSRSLAMLLGPANWRSF